MKSLLCLVLVVIASVAAGETRVAFLVGNAAYSAAPRLENPSADVTLIAETLDSLDFTVAVHHDLDRVQLVYELTRFLDANLEADVTLFYFAGHGIQFENRNFLLGTDADLQTTFDVEAQGLELGRVIDLLARKTRAALVFVDACRDNPLATDFYNRNFSATRAVSTRGLTRLSNAFNGTMVAFSASPGQVALDGEAGTSPFATALARHLPAENVEILSLMKRVIRDVRGMTGNAQTPTVTNDLVTEIYLQPGDAAVAIARRAEERLFEAVQAIGTPRAWQVFLQQFPDGHLRAEALQAAELATAIELAELSGVGNPAETVPDATRSGDRVPLTPEAIAEAEAGLALDPAAVRLIQAALAERGYDVGPLHGRLDPATRRAVADFQAAVGLPSTGAVTAGTAQRLGLVLAAVEADAAGFVASRNARKYDPAQLARIEDDHRLVRAVDALRGYELVYGYFDGRLYLGVLVWKHQTLEEARSLAESAGGYLATLTSPEENAFAFRLVKDDRRFWFDCEGCEDVYGPSFGLYQQDGAAEPDGGWVWATGEPVAFTAWWPDQPDNYNNREHLASFIYMPEDNRAPDYKDRRWGDLSGAVRAILIEIE